MVNDNISFQDSENYSGQGTNTIKDVMIRLFQKCTTEGSKEMTEGGVVTRVINEQPIEILLPNQRELFINSVQMLHIALTPHIKNSKLTEEFKLWKSNNQKLNTKYYENVNQLDQKYQLGKNPSKANDYNQELRTIKTNYDLNNVEHHKKLLIHLSQLFSDLNYFDEIGVSAG